jgi:outer membrane protein OmpA-like peptidoglycan-associated protein
MSFNLLESIKGIITPDLISSAASSLGENSSGISKALEGAVPALLSGVINKSVSDSSGIFDLVKKAAGSGVLDNLAGSLGGGNSSMMNLGTSLLSGIFGGKSNMLSSLISSFAGIKPSSGSSLLSSLAPIALGVLGKHVISNGLDARGLGNLLSSQKDTVTKAIPTGLNLSSLFSDPAPRSHPVPEPPSSGLPKWLLPLLLVVVGAALLFYLFRSCNAPKTETIPTDTTAVVAPAPDTAVMTPPAIVRESFKVELPNGTMLDAYKGGIEDQLVTFLKDNSAVVSKDKWFDFDNLTFNTGTAEITAESQAQINNIAAILKAFPKAKIKIGGYTDKTGDEAANMTLSKARAAAVKTALTTAGVGKQVTDAEGYGSQFAKAAADAPESDRVHDRRVSVSVREK